MLPEVLNSKEHFEQAKQKIEVLWVKGTDFFKRRSRGS